MKIGKSKFLICVGIVVALLVGTAYLFLHEAKTEEPQIPSTAATGTPKVIATSPATPPAPIKEPIYTEDAKEAPHRTYDFPAPTASPKALLTQDFEEGIMPPTGWSVVVNNAYTWHIESYDPYEGYYHAVCFYDPDYTGTQDEWMISPVIDLTTKGENWQLSFYWYASYYWAVDPYDNYELEAWISTDGGANWAAKLWCEDDVGVFSNWTWYRADVSLAAYLTESNVKLGFRYYGYDGAEGSFDYITVDIPPVGRCCYGDPYNPDCADVTLSECDALGGTWDYGLNCTDNPCPVLTPGDDCDDPRTVTLPAQMPYSDIGQYTCGRVDDYENTCLGYYDGGEDMIYELTVTSAVDVDIELDPKGTTYTGIAIDVSCPPGDPCMAYSTNSGSGAHGIYNIHLNPGTYYLMIDTWPSPDCIPDFDLTITTAQGPPPNDSCENATAVGDVIELPFSTTMASFDGQGTCMDSPNIWYLYTATCTGNVTVSLCGSEYDTKLAVYDGSSCDPLSPEIECNDDYCGLQSQITFAGEEGNEYLIEVGGYSSNTGDGVLTCSCHVGGEPPPNDECTGAPVISDFPTTVYGTTIDATLDCPDVLDNWYAVWYEFVLPYECNKVWVNYCPTEDSIWTVGIILYDECPPDCPGYIIATGYEWIDPCPNGNMNPRVWWYDLPGPASYWLPVAIWDENGNPFLDFGFEVTVEECVPCTVACPPNGIPEDEPWCEDDWEDIWNGGCNSTPYVFDSISCGDTICGTSGTYLYYGANYRDTDWFRVEVSEGDLTFTCVAEFPLQTILIDAGSENCVDYTILDWRQVEPCETATISWYASAGVYWLWVGPSVFSGIPCGLEAEYVFDVQCQPFGPQIAVSPESFEQLLNPTGPCSSATDNLIISSVGGEDLVYSIVENPEVDWMELSSYGGTLPPGEEDIIDVSFDAGGMAPGDYYTNLDITSNAPKGVVTVPVHLKVELAPEIDVPARMWPKVIPGCYMDEVLRVDNLGEGELRFEVSIRAAKQADVLLVDDDHSAVFGEPDFTDVVGYFTDALDANGYTYDIVEITVEGGDGPDAATMADYPVVIWSCGEAWQNQQTLTPNDEANLATYLDGGGNLFLSAHDYFYDRYGAAGSFSPGQFPYDYLGVTYTSQDYWMLFYPDIGHANGMPGSVTEGMSFDLWDPYTMKGSGSRGQVLGPDDGLYIDELTHNGVDVFNMTIPSPEGIAACQYESAKGFKTVFTTVDFAGLVDDGFRSTKAELMGSIMEWFLGAACPFTVTPEADTVEPGGHSDLILTFDGTVFEDCVDDTLICNLLITTNDCDEPELTVPVHMWSARGEVTGDCWIDIADVVFLLNYVFVAGPAPDPLCVGDLNRDDNVDSDDALYLISYLFEYGPPPEIPAAPKADEETIKTKTVRPIKQTPIERK